MADFDSNGDSNPGERLRTSAYRYGKHSPIFDRGRTLADGDVRNDATCKTVYRWFESSPWDHFVESKSALARAPFLVVTATVTATGMDGYGRSANRASNAAAASRCMVGVTWL